MDQETFGATTYDRERRLKSGGYSIVTTMDVQTQQAAKRAVERNLKTGSKNALMLAAVEPGTGRSGAGHQPQLQARRPEQARTSAPATRQRPARASVVRTRTPPTP